MRLRAAKLCSTDNTFVIRPMLYCLPLLLVPIETEAANGDGMPFQ